MKSKKIIKLIAINIFVVIILFLVSEIIVRVLGPKIFLPGTEGSLLQDSVYYNSQGLSLIVSGNSMGVRKLTTDERMWKYSADKKSKRKILFLGDSVTMGIGVDNDSTFCGRINNAANDILVYNPALIGYSVSDYKNIVKKMFVEEENRLGIAEVVLCWCLNDVYADHLVQNTPQLKSESFWVKGVIFLRNNSHLYQYLKNLFTDRPQKYFLFDNQFYNTQNKIYHDALRDLEEIINTLESVKMKMKIFILPYEYQLRDENYSLNNQPQKLLMSFINDKNVEVLDGANAFLANGDDSKGNYLFGDGIHFSERGHKLLADFILKNL